MKLIIKLLVILTFLSISEDANSQTTITEQIQIDSIIKTLPPLKKPSDEQFAKLCYYIDSSDISFRKSFREFAGILPSDPILVRRAKVYRLWNLFYEDFGCDGVAFNVQYGNILKFAVHKGYTEFIDDMYKNYGIDINKIDPIDGKSLLDFVKDEIIRYGKTPVQTERVNELKTLYIHLKNNLGAKHASELK